MSRGIPAIFLVLACLIAGSTGALGQSGKPREFDRSIDALGGYVGLPSGFSAAEIAARKAKIQESDQAIQSLAKIGPSVVPFLNTALRERKALKEKNGESKWRAVQDGIIKILSQVGSPEAVQTLIALMKAEPDLTFSVGRALGGISNSNSLAAVPALTEILAKNLQKGSGQSAQNQAAAAAEALGEIGKRNSSVAMVPALIEALSTKDVGSFGGANSLTVLRGAGQALGRIGEPALPSLMESVRKGQIQVRDLEMVGTPVIPVLLDLQRDADVAVSRDAGRTLSAIGKSAVTPLIERLKEPNVQSQIAAATALGAIGVDAAQAVPVLTSLVAHTNVEVARAAVTALAGIAGSAQAAGVVPVPVIGSNGRAVVTSIQMEIARTLVSAMQNSDATIRIAAANGLGRVSPSVYEGKGTPVAMTGAIPPLVEALGDDIASVQSEAADALRQIGLPSVPLLLNALGRPLWNGRVRAVQTLQNIGRYELSFRINGSSSDMEKRLQSWLDAFGRDTPVALVRAASLSSDMALAGAALEGLKGIGAMLSDFADAFERIRAEGQRVSGRDVDLLTVQNVREASSRAARNLRSDLSQAIAPEAVRTAGTLAVSALERIAGEVQR